jgi:hypothetical protein
MLVQLVDEKVIEKTGVLKGTRYALADPALLTGNDPNPPPKGQ